MQLSALQRGLRQYTSQINKQNAPAGKHGVFDDVPDMQSCQDYNSDCRKWAARVSPSTTYPGHSSVNCSMLLIPAPPSLDSKARLVDGQRCRLTLRFHLQVAHRPRRPSDEQECLKLLLLWTAPSAGRPEGDVAQISSAGCSCVAGGVPAQPALHGRCAQQGRGPL